MLKSLRNLWLDENVNFHFYINILLSVNANNIIMFAKILMQNAKCGNFIYNTSYTRWKLLNDKLDKRLWNHLLFCFRFFKDGAL